MNVLSVWSFTAHEPGIHSRWHVSLQEMGSHWRVQAGAVWLRSRQVLSENEVGLPGASDELKNLPAMLGDLRFNPWVERCWRGNVHHSSILAWRNYGLKEPKGESMTAINSFPLTTCLRMNSHLVPAGARAGATGNSRRENWIDQNVVSMQEAAFGHEPFTRAVSPGLSLRTSNGGRRP